MAQQYQANLLGRANNRVINRVSSLAMGSSIYRNIELLTTRTKALFFAFWVLVLWIGVPLVGSTAMGQTTEPKVQAPLNIALDCQYGLDYQGPELGPLLRLNDIRANRIDSDSKVASELAEHLQQQFTLNITQSAATEAAISYYSPKHGYWSSMWAKHTSGETNVKPFWMAGITKMAISVVIGQLIEEKQLLPVDTIDRWFPALPNADLITIEQLLSHTSGLKNFTGANNTAPNKANQKPEDLLETAVNQGRDFCPGTNWNYTDTGYLVLALIAEQLDAEPLPKIIERRIAKPLALSSFHAVDAHNTVSPDLALTEENDLAFVKQIASLHGAGALVSTSDDALRFLASYLRGELVSVSSVNDALKKLYPSPYPHRSYGWGIMVIGHSGSTTLGQDTEHFTWVGYSDDSDNGQALLLFDLDREAYMAIFLNAEAQAVNMAKDLLNIIDQFITD